jgi:hypothetical protein
MTTIYRKTAKGQAEIETRAHRLSPRLRGALIVVDGQRSQSDLAKMIPGDVEATLQQLEAEGFIDVFAVLADRPPAPAPAPAAPPKPAAAPASSAGSIDSVKRDAVRYLNDKMGPAAEGIAIKIERCKGMADLQPLLVQAASLLRSFGGADAADPFMTRFIGGPPSAQA